MSSINSKNTDNIKTNKPNMNARRPENDIPKLDTRTAGQLLDNVFSACDMKPSAIPIEVLESWGNYKKPPFEPLKKFAFVITIILILLPLMFFKPSVIVERTDVDSATNAVYDIEVKTLLPVSSVSASLDGKPVALTAKDGDTYTAELTENGNFEIIAVSLNGQTTTWNQKVTHIDSEKPEFLDSYSENGYVYILVRDTYSGIDYDNISGMTPEKYDENTGLITFKVPKSTVTITIPDKAGNEISLLLSPIN